MLQKLIELQQDLVGIDSLLQPNRVCLFVPRVGSGAVRMDPIRFQNFINQPLSFVCLSAVKVSS